MNLLTILIILIMAIVITKAALSGFMKMALSVICLGLTLIATGILTPKVNDVLMTSSYVQSFARNQAESYVNSQLGDAADILTENIDGLNIPDEAKALIKSASENVLENVGDEAAVLEDEILTELIERVIYSVSSVIAFLISFVVIFLLRHILLLFVELPVLGGINHFGGMLIGIVEAFLIAWILLALIRLSSYTGAGSALNAMIDDSFLLSWLQNHNVISHFVFARAEEFFSL